MTATLWENNASATAEFIVKLAEFQKMDRPEPSVQALAYDLGFNGGLHGIGAFNTDREMKGICLSYPVYSSNRTQWSFELHDLYVDESTRNNGVAKMLMKALAQKSVEEADKAQEKHGGRGYEYIYLEVLNWNTKAILFYEKLGGEETARIFKDGELWIRMKISVQDLL